MATASKQPVTLKQTLVVHDPAAMRAAALLGLGVTMVAKPDALPSLERENSSGSCRAGG